MTEEFFKDLTELAKKHGVAIISGNKEKLVSSTSALEGHYMFFTKGERNKLLNLGENIRYASTLVMTLGGKK